MNDGDGCEEIVLEQAGGAPQFRASDLATPCAPKYKTWPTRVRTPNDINTLLWLVFPSINNVVIQRLGPGHKLRSTRALASLIWDHLGCRPSGGGTLQRHPFRQIP